MNATDNRIYREPTANLPAKSSPAESENHAMVNIIDRAARDPAIDINKLERLIALQEKAQERLAEQAFNVSMSDAQSEMGPIAADSNNPQTKSRYASYFALDKALRPIYSKHGFALSFGTGEIPQDQYIRVLCFTSHRGGFTRTYHVDMPADGKGAKGGDVMTKTHAAGSALTYGQRYLLKMIFNIAIGSDDDGNAASPKSQSRVPSPSDDSRSSNNEPPKHQKPRAVVPEEKDTFERWEQRYVAAFSGSKSLAELTEWDTLNDKSLAMIQQSRKPEAAEIYHRIMSKHEALCEKFRRESISTGMANTVPPADTQPKTARPKDCPNPAMDPEGFLEWAEKVMAAVTDPDKLPDIWADVIDPASEGSFKPDYELLQDAYRRHEKRLGAD